MSSSVMNTAVRLPAAALRPFIKRYPGFRISGLPAGVPSELPSCEVDLIFNPNY
jgi:hypothetical protein